MLLARIDDVPSTRPSSQVKEHLLIPDTPPNHHLAGGFRLRRADNYPVSDIRTIG
jgi:hypothetical protein